MPDERFVLSAEETKTLRQIAEADHAAEARRAQIILLTADSVAAREIADRVELSQGRVRYWQRNFENDRMNIFRSLAEFTSREPDETATTAKQESAETELASTPEERQPRIILETRKRPGVTPEQPMSEAGRSILYFHFERMLRHEPGSRLGEDIEAVHDMRVAIRRMRSALATFAQFYRQKAIRPLIIGLRQTTLALGPVRDLDVFREKLARYQQITPGATDDNLAPLLKNWRRRRDKAHKKLIKYLDSDGFATFVNEVAAFVTTEGAGARKIEKSEPIPYQVRHIVPRLIYTRYEAVRAYEPLLDSAPVKTLHALRIDGKRLRYALEFFVEVLGSEAKTAIRATKQFQDHLGDLNDADIAADFLRDFIDRHERKKKPASIPEVAQYMAYQLEEKQRLIDTFPETWGRFTDPEIRRALALAVAAL